MTDVPKVIAPVGGRPFLHRLLDALAAQGIETFVLATGFAADEVENVARGINIRYSREDEPLGTGGAIAQAFDQVPGERAWVFNGDSFADVDLHAVAELAKTAPDDVWLVAIEVEDAGRYGTLEIEGDRVTRYLEKTGRAEAGWINAGIYILPRTLMPKGASSIERDLFPKWAEQGRLRAARMRGRFLDIGTPESFAAAQSFFA